MVSNKRKNEVQASSKDAPSVKKNKPSVVESNDVVLSNVVFGDSNKSKTNGSDNSSKTPSKDVKMTEKSEDSSSSSSSSSSEEEVPVKKNADVKKTISTPSKTQQSTSTKSTPQPSVKKSESSSESSSSSDEDMKDVSKASVVTKTQPPVKAAVQTSSQKIPTKKADSSSSESSSSSEDEKPVTKVQPPAKPAVVTKPAPAKAPVKKSESSSDESSSSEDEKEAPVSKTPPTKIVTKPAPQKAATQAKKVESDSSSSSSESEEEKPKAVSKPPVKSSQNTPAKKSESSSGSSSSSSEDEKEKTSLSTKQTPIVSKKVEEKKPEEKKVVKKTVNNEEVNKYREANNITYEDEYRGEEFAPIQDFKEALSIFPSELMKVTEKFTKPTPIQAQSWPIARSGRDIIAIAETGSGKTLSFTLPILAQIIAKSKKSSSDKRTPIILVLAPTRELAMQTADVCEAAGSTCGLKTLCAYGGSPREGNVRALKSGIDLLIATPGRLIDLIHDGVAILDKVNHLVLDEADRMLDDGFEPAIREIASAVPKDRQTLMFSATWPLSVQKLAHDFLQQPAKVTIGTKETDGPTANRRVTQIVEVMEYKDKERRLQDLLHKLHKSRKNRILIFALYKKEAERIEQTLRRKGWRVQGIHGDKSQALRTKAIESFRSGEEPLLVATDVAARGLDIPDVEYVINYTFPLTIQDYVHRIGRTGRAGKTGTAYTFFTEEEKSHAGELQQVLREAEQNIPQELMNFGAHVKKKEHALYGAHFKKLDNTQKATRITFDE